MADWGAGLMSWMTNASVAAPMLQRDADLKKRKDLEKQAGAAHVRDVALQKEFAQNSLRWKVEDARRAGLHPLYALGGSGATYSPSSTVISDSGSPTPDYAGAMASMGQNITRAISNTRTGEEKQMAQLQLANAKADLDGRVIDNQIKSTQLKQMQTGPAFPGSQNLVPGQGDSGINNQAQKRTNAMKGRPDAEPGAITSLGWAANADGTLTPVPSQDVKERIEYNFIQETMWALRNNILPNVTGGNPPPGYHWSYMHQAYKPGPRPKRYDKPFEALREDLAAKHKGRR